MAVRDMELRLSIVRPMRSQQRLGGGAASARTSEAAASTDNNFTALRLMLALLVVFGHFQRLAGVTSEPWPFGYAGMAVDCFFAVSGYLVSNSFDRDPSHRRFYIRRFFRIYPLYLAVVLAQTAALGCMASSGIRSIGGSLLRYFVVNAAFANFLQYDVGQGVLTGLVNPSLNPSLWTLKIEVGFYLVLPFLWWAFERWGLALLAAIFMLSATYQLAWNEAGQAELARQLPGQLQFFVLGMAAYRYRSWLVISKRWGLLLTILLAALVTMLIYLHLHAPIIYPLIVGTMVPIAALSTPRIRLRSDISYGVYLLHGPVIQLSLLMGIYRSGWIGVLAILAVVIPAAGFCERVIEAPGIAFGRRLGQWVSRDSAVARDAGRQPALATAAMSRPRTEAGEG